MLYKQFLEITDKLNPEFVEEFDYWLATLPTNRLENITASVVAKKNKSFLFSNRSNSFVCRKGWNIRKKLYDYMPK